MRAAARAVAIGAIGLCAAALAPVAGAANFNVNSTTDAGDPAQGDGECDSNPLQPGPQCTLRAALEQAGDPSSPGRDTIKVPAGTYTLNSPSELVVNSDVVVDGAAASSTIIRQALNGRVIDVLNAVGRLDLRDVTVRDGVLADDGAGIRNLERLILRRSIVKANQAFGDGESGGGIATLQGGQTTILDSVIGDPAGGAEANRGATGGGIFADCSLGASVVIQRSIVVGNTATDTLNDVGGGIDACAGAPIVNVIEDSHFYGNRARVGAALYVSGETRVERTTISGNVSESGAVTSFLGTLDLRNSTVSGNTVAAGGTHSGLTLGSASGGSTVTHSTFAANAPGPGGAADLRTLDSVGVRASILASPGTRCIEDGSGAINSNGFNLEAGSSCGFNSTGDAPSTDPRLAPLARNGGVGPTHALRPGSPAINRVASGCPPPATDQRGTDRPQAGRCDGGPYELARCRGVAVNRIGTGVADRLVGTPGPDGFLLRSGNDVALGGGGADAACGGRGRDRLLGQAGSDRLLGQAGNDRLLGGAGRDRLLGGGGRDRLVGGAGRDLCRGGPRRDRRRGCERGSG